MTRYRYYGMNSVADHFGPVWRYPEDSEEGVYLREEYSEPAVLRQYQILGSGFREFDETEVPEWAKPATEYAQGQRLRGKTWASYSTVEGLYRGTEDDGEVQVTVTHVVEDLRSPGYPLQIGDRTLLHPESVEVLSNTAKKLPEEAVTPGEVNVKVALDTSEFVEALEKARTAFEGGGVRDGAEKVERFELAWTADQPYEDQMLTRYARWMARGADKYADRNWESFASDDALEHAKGSLLRHVFKLLAGQVDEDHAAAVWFNVAAIELIRGKG